MAHDRAPREQHRGPGPLISPAPFCGAGVRHWIGMAVSRALTRAATLGLVVSLERQRFHGNAELRFAPCVGRTSLHIPLAAAARAT